MTRSSPLLGGLRLANAASRAILCPGHGQTLEAQTTATKDDEIFPTPGRIATRDCGLQGGEGGQATAHVHATQAFWQSPGVIHKVFVVRHQNVAAVASIN